MRSVILFQIISVINCVTFDKNHQPTVFGDSFVSRAKDFPYQVAITNPNGGHHCGGAIFTHKWIITTAHCIPLSKWMRQFTVKVGNLDINQCNEYLIMEGYAHEAFQSDPGPPVNDIGMIKVEKELKLNDFVMPIKINWKFIGEDIQGVVTGW